ncbi:MAG: asparagine synthase (glutamine-hydrolyzing) [Verrucomicrobiae bacterium]
MCGIAGYLSFDGAPARADVLQKMAGRIAHRGPDGCGDLVRGQAGIAHRRLSIIDVDGGAQPMANEDGSVWAVFNGEIYNHAELRAELCRHHFVTRCDTEVIVHAYEEWGAECVGRFRGMFALAVLDLRDRSVFLARDRIGIKPLAYLSEAGRFAFASELGAFAALDNPPREILPEAVGMFFRHACIPSPHTIFRNVFKLPPAHTLRVSFDGGEVRPQRYWQARFEPEENVREEEWAERLTAALKESVRAHLMSDVAFGAFLSGGVDSSAVVALMASELPSPVKTFSIGFENQEFSELPFARQIAERFGTEHHEEIVRPDALAVLPEIVRHHGEPFGDSSAVPTHYLAKLAAGRVKMALSGDGGDEIFAGYPWYANVVRTFGGPSGFLRQRLGFAIGDKADPIRTWQDAQAVFDPASLARLLRREFLPPAQASPTLPADLCSRMQACDLEGYLPDDILAKVDIATMSFGLEARVPLLDHRIVELCGRIPARFKLRNSPGGFDQKSLLKKVFAPLLDAEFLSRKKQGFSVPLRDWFAPGSRAGIAAQIRSSRVGDFCQMAEIDRLLAAPGDVSTKLWLLVVLAEWLEQNPSAA